MRTALSITGVGLLSPVGQSPAACMHSVRSGVSALSMLPLPDRAREWIAGASVLRWTPYIGTRRLEEYLTIALQQAWQQCTAASSMPHGRAALVIGQPEAIRPGKAP